MYFNFTLVQRKRLALLDFLIAASQEGLLSDLDIRQEVHSFMFGVRIFNFSLSFLYLELFGCTYIDSMITGS